jgi:hypothetical protein
MFTHILCRENSGNPVIIKGSGAWPFLVRGMICLVNSDNEREDYERL